MKRIAILILPMLVIIAVVFEIRGNNIRWNTFLNFIQSLRFDNTIETYKLATSNLGRAVDTFKTMFSSSPNIVQIVKSIFNVVASILKGSYYALNALYSLVFDLFHNLIQITDFLFGGVDYNKYIEIGCSDLNPYCQYQYN